MSKNSDPSSEQIAVACPLTQATKSADERLHANWRDEGAMCWQKAYGFRHYENLLATAPFSAKPPTQTYTTRQTPLFCPKLREGPVRCLRLSLKTCPKLFFQNFQRGGSRLSSLRSAVKRAGSGQKCIGTKRIPAGIEGMAWQCDPAGGCSALEIPLLAANEAVSSRDRPVVFRSKKLSTSVRSWIDSPSKHP